MEGRFRQETVVWPRAARACVRQHRSASPVRGRLRRGVALARLWERPSATRDRSGGSDPSCLHGTARRLVRECLSPFFVIALIRSCSCSSRSAPPPLVLCSRAPLWRRSERARWEHVDKLSNDACICAQLRATIRPAGHSSHRLFGRPPDTPIARPAARPTDAPALANRQARPPQPSGREGKIGREAGR